MNEVKSLEVLIQRINKQYGENSLGFAKNLKYSGIPRVTSGSSFLDWALGVNEADKTSGWPLGRIVELYGPESAGKSLISLMTIAEAQRVGKVCAYFDCEGSFDKTFATQLGVDVNKLLLSRENAGEKVIEMVCRMLESREVSIVVFDSLAAMIPQMEIDDPLEQMQMAPVARMMSKALRKLTFLNKATLLIFINQLRENPGAKYGNPEYTPGGRALKFYASLRVDVRRGDWIFDSKTKKKKVGQVVKFRVVKNKSALPLKEGYFKYLHKGEIDKTDELISLGLLNETIKRKGAYYYLGKDRFLGRDELESKLKKDKKLFEKAKEMIFA